MYDISFKNTGNICPAERISDMTAGFPENFGRRDLRWDLCLQLYQSERLFYSRLLTNLETHYCRTHCCKKIMAFSTLPITTVGLSITTFVSQNVGAEKPDRVRKGIRYGCIITTVWSVIALIILELLSPVLVNFIGFRGGYCCDYRCELFKIQRPVLYSSGNTYNVKMFITGYGQKILPILSSVIELLGKVILHSLLFHIWDIMA